MELGTAPNLSQALSLTQCSPAILTVFQGKASEPQRNSVAALPKSRRPSIISLLNCRSSLSVGLLAFTFPSLLANQSSNSQPLSSSRLSGSQNNASHPQTAYILIPGTCEIVSLHGKRDFTDLIKLRNLRWEWLITLD